jgi:hypothetical protein
MTRFYFMGMGWGAETVQSEGMPSFDFHVDIVWLNLRIKNNY